MLKNNYTVYLDSKTIIILSKFLHRLNILKRLALKYLYKTLGQTNKFLQPSEKFAIKKGYHHAKYAGKFNDTANTDEWQNEVYQFAATFMNQKNYHHIIDLGCGSAYKLIKYFDQYDSTGIETETTYQWLKKTYPTRKWLQVESHPTNLSTDVVICSDVIEHIPDPDELMEFIRSIQSNYIILSTPERDAVAGKNDYGPPENSTHYREWNSKEFNNYISQWFVIEQQEVLGGKSISQAIVCRLK